MIPLMPQTFPQTQEERLHTHRHKQAQCSFTFPPHKASLGTPIPLRSKKRRGKRKRTKPKAPSAKATYLALPSKVKPLKRSKSPRTLMALAVKSHHQMLASSSTSSSSPSSQPLPPPPPAATSSSCLPADQPSPAKRKRRPPGTPDPDAEVVALSPRTLLESDRYVCEICGQGFQREQNLQMHRRRHKVPWRLVKRAATTAGTTDQDGGGGGTASAGGTGGGAAAAASTVPRKRVFVCPEPSCLHHDPAHALGDLVGIKKHFRRKHGGRRQWVCARCAKGYAVQSDYKAHLKTCGTRGHSCDCGRVFSRVESFIEHQDACNSGRMRAEAVPSTVALPVIRPAVLSRPPPPPSELQLLPAAATKPPLAATPVFSATTHAATATTATKLELSIGRDDHDHEEGEEEEAMRRAMEEKAAADGERERAREEAAAAERALEEARRARHRARGELEAACALRDHAARLLAQVTCHACRQQRSFADAAGVHVVVSMGVAGGEGHGGSAAAREALMVRARGGLGL